MSPHTTTHLEREIALHRQLVHAYQDRYRHAFSRVFQEEWNRALLEMTRVRADRVLDLGCGTGVLLADLIRQSRFVVALDVSLDMMRVARGMGVLLVAGNGSKLPFSDATFDLIICRGVLHHLSELPATLTEIRRILRPGGQLTVSEPSNDWWLVRAMRKLMYRFSDQFEEEDEGFLSERFLETLHTVGFEDIRLKRFGYSAYVLAGFPDLLPVLRYIPGNVLFTRMLVRLDRIWARLPTLNRMSLQIIVSAQKTAQSRS